MRLSALPRLYIDCSSERTVCSLNQTVVFDEVSLIALFPETQTVVAVGSEAAVLNSSGKGALEVTNPFARGRLADQDAAALFLMSLIKRVEPTLPLAAKVLGISGRITHITAASPAQLHLWSKVLKSVGLQRLQLTPRSQALAQYVYGSTNVTQLRLCEISSDFVECTAHTRNVCNTVVHIPWGVNQVLEYICEVVEDKLGCNISTSSAQVVLEKVIDCTVLVDPQIKQTARKVSLKAKERDSLTSKTIVVSGSLFIDTLEQAIRPLVEGITQFWEVAVTETDTGSLSVPLRLAGMARVFPGLTAYLSHILSTDVLVIPEPQHAVQQGLLLLDT